MLKQNYSQPVHNELTLQALNERRFRRELAHESFESFCKIYLAHHFYLTPSFGAREMLGEMSDHQQKRLEIIGFRGCAKSTFGSLALVLWCALEHPDRYPFIVPLSNSGDQSSVNIASIRYELDNNELLINDYGHLKYKRIDDAVPELTFESDEEWQKRNMVLENGVRIMARSRGQRVRGLKHREHRIKLAIADDIEDLASVNTKENRDKTDRWFRGELMPSLDAQTGRLILIGNWLHRDGLMARTKMTGSFKVLEYPLVVEDVCQWPAMYPNKEALDEKRKEMGEIAFRREMMLEVVAEEGQDVKPDDIVYYDEIPASERGYVGHGVDLAIGKKATNDYTSIVSGEVRYIDERPFIYILPNVINARMDFNETINTVSMMPQSGGVHLFCVENVAYQLAAIQEMERRMLAVRPMRPNTDKRARLRIAATYIKNGTVRFPRHGMDELLGQLFDFGVDSHDDMVDALVYLILGLAEEGVDLPQVFSV